MKKGWQTKRLGEVCEIIKGRKPALKATQSPGDLPYLVAKVMRGSQEAEYASMKDRNSITVAEHETIIICDGSNSGEVFTAFSGVLSSTMGKIAKKSEVDDNFLRAFLASTFDIFNGAKTGSAIPHLDKEAMYALEFPVPPLPEQQRIVGILDEAFDGIATAKTNAEKNLQNARALFESHLQSVFTQRGKGWVDKQLGDVCELFQGLCINAKTKHLLVKKSSLPLLRIKDLRTNSVEQFVAETGWPKNAQVNESEIIYTRTGQIGLVFRGRVGVLHNNCFKVRPKPVLNSGYLFWWLQNPAFRARITTLASKAAQPDITHSLFKVQPILLPPRDYQDRAITLIDGMRQETQRLVHLYERKLAALEALKKSLLHQAFSGEL